MRHLVSGPECNAVGVFAMWKYVVFLRSCALIWRVWVSVLDHPTSFGVVAPEIIAAVYRKILALPILVCTLYVVHWSLRLLTLLQQIGWMTLACQTVCQCT